jgi:uncharacterized membrane protein YgcG
MSSIVKSPFFGFPNSEFMLVKQSTWYNALQILAGVVFTLYLRTGFLLIKDSYSISNYAIIPLLVASILLVLIISYIQCSIVNVPFSLTAKVKLILAVKALLLLGIVILTIFDITHTILDIVAECGVFIGSYCVGGYTLSCTMDNSGGGSRGSGGHFCSSRGVSGPSSGGSGQGVNSGGNSGGEETPSFLTQEEANNHDILMQRYAQHQFIAKYEYDLILKSIERMNARAY